VAGMFEDLAGHSAPSYAFAITLGLCLATVGMSQPRTALEPPA
jgi:hypothetical protein